MMRVNAYCTLYIQIFLNTVHKISKGNNVSFVSTVPCYSYCKLPLYILQMSQYGTNKIA